MGDILNDYVSVYLDDMLVFLSGSRKDYIEKVREVFRRLREAELNLDLEKSEFVTQEVKYFRFIIKAGKGIQADLEKVRAIRK